MNRRWLTLIAVVVTALFTLFGASAMTIGAFEAHAAPAGKAPVQPFPRGGKAKHVCGNPRAGYAQCHAEVLTSDGATPFALAGPAGYGPADLRSAYNITATGAPTTTIAIIGAFGYANAERDLATYRTQFSLPPCTVAGGCLTIVNQDGQSNPLPAANTAWSQEAALDLDMASAICSACKILYVQATSNRITDLAAAVATAGRMGAHAISNSYGAPESSTFAPYESAYDIPGVAVTVSTGDSGYGPQFPASSPHVIAVGGTSLTKATNARGWSESAWKLGGSGCSTLFAKPDWQTDSGCSKRTSADIAAVADPATGVAVYSPVDSSSSSWQVYGGTSVAAPIIAGAFAVVNGTVNYAHSLYANAASLNDVTSGSNGDCGTYLCNAGAGYDGPTGLGTPNGLTAFSDSPTAPTDPTVSVAVSGAGSVISTPAGISCSNPPGTSQACSSTFPAGTPLTLQATPVAGYTFAGWGGACSGTSTTCSTTVDKSKAVSATFQQVVAAPTPMGS